VVIFGFSLRLRNAVIRFPTMQATLSEFRNRWWIIFSIFGLAFLAYAVDQATTGVVIGKWINKWRGGPENDNIYRLVFGFAALLQVMAALIRTWGTSYLQAEVMRDSRVHTEKLLADGPYRYVRNPLYLGNIIMAAAIGFLASRIGFLILVFGMTIFVLRLIGREESELARDQGEPYRRYCAAVPRLLPSLWPRVPAAGNRAYWAHGFRAELMSWLMGMAMAGFAITLNIKVYWVLFALAMASAWFYKRPETKEKSTPA
jgi:protein-S-isoprenylcysteine O-methyltransferase Ste14